jgi:hypothetical protein
MARNLFQRKGKTKSPVQRKIDSLKQDKKDRKSAPVASPVDDSSIDDSSPDMSGTIEEVEYLRTLERRVQSRQSVLVKQGAKKGRRPEDIDEEPPEDEDPREIDPFSADVEVERLVRGAQKEFDEAVSKGKRPVRRATRPKRKPAEKPKAAKPGAKAEKPRPKTARPPQPQPPEPKAAAPPEPPAPAAPPPQARSVALDQEEPYEGSLPFAPGTIVRMGDDSVAVIVEEIRNREYDLVYILCAVGRVEPRGVCLFAYELERLGRLPREELKRIGKNLSWNRDRVVYYLDDIAFASGIPSFGPPQPQGEQQAPPEEAATASAPGEPHDDGHSLQRGRSLSILFGEKSWDAVYWGEDQLGVILAHTQNGDWELMHLDLSRFGDGVKRGPLLSRENLQEIEESIVGKLTQKRTEAVNGEY